MDESIYKALGDKFAKSAQGTVDLNKLAKLCEETRKVINIAMKQRRVPGDITILEMQVSDLENAIERGIALVQAGSQPEKIYIEIQKHVSSIHYRLERLAENE